MPSNPELQGFILTGEEKEYETAFNSFMLELSPEGILEETFAIEIIGVHWRLRRCRLSEAVFALEQDPQEIEQGQNSVDRARAQSHVLLRRSLAELRKLQTERVIRRETGFVTNAGLADTRQILSALGAKRLSNVSEREESADPTGTPDKRGTPDKSYSRIKALMDEIEKAVGGDLDDVFSDQDTSFCKNTQPAPRSTPQSVPESRQIGRNTPCPCASGRKFKRCCGKDAPPLLNFAA